MTGREKQLGSSTTELLFATAVFVGVLVYASFFAFEKTIQATAEVETDAVATSEIAGSIVSPLSSGIFNSETLPVDERDITVDAEQATLPEVTDKVPAKASTETPQASPELLNQAGLAGSSKEHRFPSVQPGNVTGDQLSSGYRQQHLAGLANQYYSHAFGDGRGRGRSRESMKADGEFNFTLNFKSRARMDADTESRLSSDLSAHSNANYQYWNTYSPAYQYYHQNY